MIDNCSPSLKLNLFCTLLAKEFLRILKVEFFNFVQGEQFSIITIRGLGVTEIQNQIDQLMLWFGSFEREIKNFDKELIKRE